jgi:hypothetical protein
MSSLHHPEGKETTMWNHRIVKRVQKLGSEEFTSYGIYEVYYDEKGQPNGITESPVEPFGENATELLASWAMMSSAFTKPILDYEEFVNKDSEGITLEDLTSISNITFKHDEVPVTKKELRKIHYERSKERELAEIIYSNECVDKSPEKVFDFGLSILRNGNSRPKA